MNWYEDWELAALMVERTVFWTCPRCDLRQGDDRRRRVRVCRACGTEVHKNVQFVDRKEKKT